MNLRQLTHDQEAILSQVEDGDFTLEQVSDHLDMLDSERKQKIENYLHVINRIESEVVALTAEIKRLDTIRDGRCNALSNIKDWLLMSMKDGEKHDFDLFKVSRVKGRQGVTVIDDKKLPMQFMTHKPESWQPDKRAILAKMKEGEEIAGAELTITKPSLRIK